MAPLYERTGALNWRPKRRIVARAVTVSVVLTYTVIRFSHLCAERSPNGRDSTSALRTGLR